MVDATVEASNSEKGNNMNSNGASPVKTVPEGPDEIVTHPLIGDLLPGHLGGGVLIPLKTTLETRQDHTIVQGLITRTPVKYTNDVVKYVLYPNIT
jgi:tRNA-specific adenosine deaminase 3